MKPTYKLPDLSLPIDLETVPILRALTKASTALAELKGLAQAIPNQGILIDTLALQEAKASSEIENIVTTQDELFRAGPDPSSAQSPAAKEVARYCHALKRGHDSMMERGSLTNNILIEMYQVLKLQDDGFRVTPGTVLKNELTGEIANTPPQDANEIARLMADLELFINTDGNSSLDPGGSTSRLHLDQAINADESQPLDPLIKMAIIHHQFESIHPFSDGNGRIGRILNVLYLTRTGLLDTPILYLSRHITRTKGEYYRLLQAVRDSQGAPKDWEAWILYILEAVTNTSGIALQLVKGIRDQMAVLKNRLRGEMTGLYSQDLVNNLFRHPYTRIDLIMRDLDVTRPTATKYLDALAEKGIVRKQRVGRSNYYINQPLVRLLTDLAGE